MKFIMTAIMLVLTSMPVVAQHSPLYLQLKYSPLGTINDGEDTVDYVEGDYQPYDMNYEHTLGAKLLYDPVYLAVQQNIAAVDNSAADATLDTISMGLAGFNYERLAGLYLMGSMGVGAGQFKYEQYATHEWETLLEASAEVGFHLQEHFLLGMGIDYQRFGDFGDHQANYWNLYLATGIVF